MGNGESTARRISMQRSEEGVIQVHEDVVSMLQNGKRKLSDQGVGAQDFDENELKAMLKKAYEAGQSHEASRWKREKAELLAKTELPESALNEGDKLWKHQLEEKENHLNDLQEKLTDRESEIQQQLKLRRKEIQDTFTKSSQEIQDRFKPLQNAAICRDAKESAVNCFMENASQPLKCSSLVKDFTKCVQETRLKSCVKEGV